MQPEANETVSNQMFPSINGYKSKRYLDETSNIPTTFKVLSPNHLMYEGPADIKTRLEKLSDPYLGQKPNVVNMGMPRRLQHYTLVKKTGVYQSPDTELKSQTKYFEHRDNSEEDLKMANESEI